MAGKFVEATNEMTEQIEKLGPNPIRIVNKSSKRSMK
jgi:coenzyme F420-reducing hydrogenase delta subunit